MVRKAFTLRLLPGRRKSYSLQKKVTRFCWPLPNSGTTRPLKVKLGNLGPYNKSYQNPKFHQNWNTLSYRKKIRSLWTLSLNISETAWWKKLKWWKIVEHILSSNFLTFKKDRTCTTRSTTQINSFAMKLHANPSACGSKVEVTSTPCASSFCK